MTNKYLINVPDFSNHFEQRSRERGFNSDDIEAILRNGTCGEGFVELKGRTLWYKDTMKKTVYNNHLKGVWRSNQKNYKHLVTNLSYPSNQEESGIRLAQQELLILSTNVDRPEELWIGVGASQENDAHQISVTFSQLFPVNESPIIICKEARIHFDQSPVRISFLDNEEEWIYEDNDNNGSFSFRAPDFWSQFAHYPKKNSHPENDSSGLCVPGGNGVTGVWRSKQRDQKAVIWISLLQELHPDLIFVFELCDNPEESEIGKGFSVRLGIARKYNNEYIAEKCFEAPVHYNRNDHLFELLISKRKYQKLEYKFMKLDYDSSSEGDILVITETHSNREKRRLQASSVNWSRETQIRDKETFPSKVLVPFSSLAQVAKEERGSSLARRIMEGDIDNIKQLMSYSRDEIQIPMYFSRGADEQSLRYTPLQIAVSRHGDFERTKEIIEILREKGENVNDFADHGRGTNLLHMVARSICEKSDHLRKNIDSHFVINLCDYLKKELRIDIQQKNIDKRTPLEIFESVINHKEHYVRMKQDKLAFACSPSKERNEIKELNDQITKLRGMVKNIKPIMKKSKKEGNKAYKVSQIPIKINVSRFAILSSLY
eukprot:gb/GECH01013276.1/.p1 GENE.gb/GECH01013276.1/~~gb/GECH01013276.1/.p1  ORF type:complete len:603 (+),score=126.54 gb/GECH01013276.1/:1-1809(+)